jgi:hypothetical protein
MFPDSSGATAPVAPTASERPENDGDAEVMVPDSLGSDSSAVKPPEPHWDPVIAAATD